MVVKYKIYISLEKFLKNYENKNYKNYILLFTSMGHEI